MTRLDRTSRVALDIERISPTHSANMEIDYIDKRSWRFVMLISGAVVVASLVIFVFVGLILDDSGSPRNWKAAATFGVLMLGPFFIATTYARRTSVDSQTRTLVVADRVLWILPIATKKISFEDVSAIVCKHVPDSDGDDRFYMFIKSGEQQIAIMARTDQQRYSGYMKQAENLSTIIGTSLVVPK